MKHISIIIFSVFLSAQLFSQMAGNWTLSGPDLFPVNISGQIHGIGRCTQIKFHPTNPQKMYVTSASGGLYVSNDAGASWHVTGTDFLPSLQCASVCIDNTNDSILYLGTGDPNYYGSSYGIYKSTDAGATWQASNATIGNRMALEIIMSPYDHNILIAATNSGIWKTYDGGLTWTAKVAGGQFTDMQMKPAPGSQTLYAATHDFFFKSEDLGENWALITNGTQPPVGNNGNGIRIATSAADSNVVYFAMVKDEGTVYKSTDGGNSFTTVYHNPSQSLTGYDANGGGQGNYNFSLCANPNNADELYTSSHCVWHSTDGGLSWTKLTNWWAILHTDMHQILYNPYNNGEIWNANDGGVWFSTDGGTNWTPKSDGIAATEVYHAGQSNTREDIISIGTQDNGELFHANPSWKCNRGGDWGPKCGFDYIPLNFVYYFSEGKRRRLLPNSGSINLNIPFVTNNNTLMAFTPLDSTLGYASKDTICYSQNLQSATPSWNFVTTSITNTIKAICIAPFDKNLIYAVTDNSKVYRIENATSGNPVITMYNAPYGTAASASITLIAGDTNVVLLTCGNKIYRSADKGQSWTNITANYAGSNIKRIYSDDFTNDESVYIGSSMGVWYRNASNSNWINYSAGLPTIADITDFMVYNDGTAASKLRVSYYGRGVWESPLNKQSKPLAGFDALPKTLCAGQSVTFYNQSFNAGNYTWYFQGGSPATSTALNPVVSYFQPGNYLVSLYVSNGSGSNSILKTNYIHVTSTHALPLVEGFESGLPANFLYNDAGEDGVQWKLSNTGGYGNSFNSVMFDNFNNDANGKRDEFITPRLSFMNVNAAQLTFDRAYCRYDASYHDTLAILVSTDCGLTFTEVYNKGYTDLATAPDNTGYFIPAATQWATDTVDLSAYINQSDVEIIFQNRGHYGNNLFIDNININATTNQQPVVDFTAFNTIVCEGNSVSFTDASGGMPNAWQWTFAGGNPSSSTLQNPVVNYATSGNYDVTSIASNAFGSDTLTYTSYITVVNPALTASIGTNGNTLFSNTPAAGYQWYLNGIALQGETGDTLFVTQAGSYTLLLTDLNGCTSLSLPVNITISIQQFNNDNDVVVYPNPFSNSFTITIQSKEKSVCNIRIFNILGKECLYRNQSIQNGNNKISIDNNLPAGIYFIEISYGTERKCLKVISE